MDAVVGTGVVILGDGNHQIPSRAWKRVAEYVVPIDIRFSDLDALGHVNSTKVLQFAEHARVNWLIDVAGAPSSSALPIILASAHAEYKAPIQKSDALEVALTVGRIGTKSWQFDYDVRSPKTGQVYATVQTTQVAYDYSQAKSVAIDAHMRAKLEALKTAHPRAP